MPWLLWDVIESLICLLQLLIARSDAERSVASVKDTARAESLGN